jgi:hypothetical protein
MIAKLKAWKIQTQTKYLEGQTFILRGTTDIIELGPQ